MPTAPVHPAYTLGRPERIKSRKLAGALFARAGSRSLAAFPLRLVYVETPCVAGQPPVQILVSVPKRRLRQAVRRNRVKRQLREAYRLNKHLLTVPLAARPGKALALALLWQADRPGPTALVEERMKHLLSRLAATL